MSALIVVPRNSIEEDANDVNKLVTAAKMGKWNEVFRILGSPENPKKTHLINCIPENRRWGVLQQAVWWQNTDVIRTLIRFRTCDPFIEAKEGRCEMGSSSKKTALEIAQGFGYLGVAKVLENNVCGIEEQELDTFQLYTADTENETLGLVQITLAAYKNTFCPKQIDQSTSLLSVLKEIYRDMNSSATRWKAIRDKICESVYVVCDDTYEKIKACTTREDFYQAVIKTYTVEENYLYDHLNTALRRQHKHDYRPTASDLALGPYVVVYQMLLLFWNNLRREINPTYRKMKICSQDLQEYKLGTKFVWRSFVSSSAVRKKAVPFPTCAPSGDEVILFTIDNSTSSAWQPRNIEAYAMYMEKERTYPAGATFQVTGIAQKNGQTNVTIKLLCD